MAKKDVRFNKIVVDYGEIKIFSQQDFTPIVTAIDFCSDNIPLFIKNIFSLNSHEILSANDILNCKKLD